MGEDDFEHDYFKLIILKGQFNSSEIFLYFIHERTAYQYRIELGEKFKILHSREFYSSPEDLAEKAKQLSEKQNGRAAVVYLKDLKEFPGTLEEKLETAVKAYFYSGMMRDEGIPTE